MNLLDVQNLTVSFGNKAVVHGINFAVKAGERVALVGESGSGKTVTALSLLRLALNAQLSGSATFRGAQSIDLLQISEQQMRDIRGRDIAMIFQEPMTALNPLFTIGNQIAEVLEQKQAVSGIDIAYTAIKLIASTGIADPERCAKSYPHQLSGGQRQRAMIAMALACQPKLLLADEPTTALDVSLRLQILELLSGLQKQNGMAVLLITHDLNLVRKFADRIIVMEGGHIVEQGTVSDVFANPQHAYTRKLLDSKPVRDVLESSAVINQQDQNTTVTQQPSMQAKDLCVSYPAPLTGVKGGLKRVSLLLLNMLILNCNQHKHWVSSVNLVLVRRHWHWLHWVCKPLKDICKSMVNSGDKEKHKTKVCVRWCKLFFKTRFLHSRHA